MDMNRSGQIEMALFIPGSGTPYFGPNLYYEKGAWFILFLGNVDKDQLGLFDGLSPNVAQSPWPSPSANVSELRSVAAVN